jgi:peptidoglycan/LPS O-acetylase OafA/YrhL
VRVSDRNASATAVLPRLAHPRTSPAGVRRPARYRRAPRARVPFRVASMVGGYVGVDVFFVLSGFLITGLLLDGRGLLGFYARRMRRLLPAALVVLVVTSVAWTAVAGSVERDPVIGDVHAAALYVSNWHFAAQATNYFASTDAPSCLST